MRSTISPDLARSVAVKYKLNEWVEPKVKGSKLFVFGSKKAALKYASHTSHKMFACEVREPKRGFIRMSLLYGKLSNGSVKEFWKCSLKRGVSTPSNTYFVSAVKLLKEIR